MSKKFKLTLLLFLPLFVMCGKDNPDLYQDASMSDSEGSNTISGQITIADLKRMHNGMPTVVTKDVHIVGRVISSDEAGNIYKSLYVEDATGGIEIKLDRTNNYQLYKRWYNIKVNCNSLVLDTYGGAIQLGSRGTDNLIPPVIQSSAIKLIEGSWTEVIPQTIALDGLAGRYVNCFVRLTDVQFADEEIGLTWSDGEETTERIVVDRSGRSIKVRTSNHADFAGFQLPSGSGSIQGILTYFNGNYQMVMNENSDAIMKQDRFVYPCR